MSSDNTLQVVPADSTAHPRYNALISAICTRHGLAVVWSSYYECYVVVPVELGMLVSVYAAKGMGFTKFGALVDAIKENGTSITIMKRYMRRNNRAWATLAEAMEAFNNECAPVTENNVVNIPVVFKPHN